MINVNLATLPGTDFQWIRLDTVGGAIPPGEISLTVPPDLYKRKIWISTYQSTDFWGWRFSLRLLLNGIVQYQMPISQENPTGSTHGLPNPFRVGVIGTKVTSDETLHLYDVGSIVPVKPWEVVCRCDQVQALVTLIPGTPANTIGFMACKSMALW